MLSPVYGGGSVIVLVVTALIVWQLVFHLILVVYYAIFGLVIILCLCAVG